MLIENIKNLKVDDMIISIIAHIGIRLNYTYTGSVLKLYTDWRSGTEQSQADEDLFEIYSDSQSNTELCPPDDTLLEQVVFYDNNNHAFPVEKIGTYFERHTFGELMKLIEQAVDSLFVSYKTHCSNLAHNMKKEADDCCFNYCSVNYDIKKFFVDGKEYDLCAYVKKETPTTSEDSNYAIGYGIYDNAGDLFGHIDFRYIYSTNVQDISDELYDLCKEDFSDYIRENVS